MRHEIGILKLDPITDVNLQKRRGKRQNTYLKAFMKLKSFKGNAAFGS